MGSFIKISNFARIAPSLELLAFCSASAIGSDFDEGDPNGSKPWNDGELNWT